MDRVFISGEAPGSTTYYLLGAPDQLGTRLFEMERYGDAVILEAWMDIGTSRSTPTQEIRCEEQYDALVNRPQGRTIYSCRFMVRYEGLDITVLCDFQMRRLTIAADPDAAGQQAQRLAQFLQVLTKPEYYKEQERALAEKEYKVMDRIYWALTIAAAVLLLIGFLKPRHGDSVSYEQDHIYRVVLLAIAFAASSLNLVRQQLVKRRLRRNAAQAQEHSCQK